MKFCSTRSIGNNISNRLQAVPDQFRHSLTRYLDFLIKFSLVRGCTVDLLPRFWELRSRFSEKIKKVSELISKMRDSINFWSFLLERYVFLLCEKKLFAQCLRLRNTFSRANLLFWTHFVETRYAPTWTIGLMSRKNVGDLTFVQLYKDMDPPSTPPPPLFRDLGT